MDRNGIVQKSDWKDGFLFVGNQLVLNFVNTRPVQNGEPQELLPDFGALLRWFQAADLLSARAAARLTQQWEGSARSRRTLQALQELRERWRKEILGWEKGGEVHQATLHKLNELLAKHPMRSRLRMTEGKTVRQSWFEMRNPEDLFAALANSAADLFTNIDRSRVRKCDNCVLHFYDASKKGTRRWCSMQLCGNRFKVAAYAARKRENKNIAPITRKE
jgi:predicted RNA-binding Zn ribbon-like protein